MNIKFGTIFKVVRAVYSEDDLIFDIGDVLVSYDYHPEADCVGVMILAPRRDITTFVYEELYKEELEDLEILWSPE